MKANDILLESPSVDIEHLKQKISNPNVTVASALSTAVKMPSIRQVGKSYLELWKTKYRELQNTYNDVISDSILAMELVNNTQVDITQTGINKTIQDIVDLKNNLNNNLALEKMVTLVALDAVTKIKNSTPSHDEVIDYGGPITNVMAVGSTHAVKVLYNGSNRRWIKFNDAWFWDKHMNFVLDTEIENPKHIADLDNNKSVKNVFMYVININPLKLQRMNTNNNNKIIGKHIADA